MTHDEVKAKRRFWHPRFSLRTLAIVMTLLCAYFASWEATKRYGEKAVREREASLGEITLSIQIEHVHSPVPFFVVAGVTNSFTDATNGVSYNIPFLRRYYLWFGKVVLVREWWDPNIQRGSPQ